LGHVAQIDRNAFGSRKRSNFVPCVVIRVVRSERGLFALDHRAPEVALEFGAFEAGKCQPEDLAANGAGLAMQNAMRFAIDIIESPLAIKREKAFGDALENVDRVAIGRGADVLDTMNDVFDLAVVAKHRRVYRHPVALLESATQSGGQTQVVTLQRNLVRDLARQHAIERGAQIPYAAGFRLRGIVREDFEHRPAENPLVGVRCPQILVARGDDCEVAIRLEDQEQPWNAAEDSLDIRVAHRNPALEARTRMQTD